MATSHVCHCARSHYTGVQQMRIACSCGEGCGVGTKRVTAKSCYLCLPQVSALWTGSWLPPCEQRQQPYWKETDRYDNDPSQIATGFCYSAATWTCNLHKIPL